MNYTVAALIGCLALFFGMLLFAWLGYRFGRYRLQKGVMPVESSGAIVGSVFALLGLMIAFTFTSAFNRLDNRRQLIVQEANNIGTAYLRVDLLPAEAQPELRQLFHQYTLARAALYTHLTQDEAAKKDYEQAAILQNQIWDKAVAATDNLEDPSARMLVLPALNEMIDITTTRAVAIMTHPPSPIWITLAFIALACAGMAGYNASSVDHPKVFHFVVFAAVTAITVYLILDVEYPRFGLVRLNSVNQLLFDLAETMK